MTLTLKVYEADSTTLVSAINAGEWLSAEFAEVNSQPGGWSIVLPNHYDSGAANTALTLLRTGRLMRFLVDDVAVFQGVIEDTVTVAVDQKEKGGEITTVSGRGTLAIFDKVRVRPDKGIGNRPTHPTRWFNHAADRLRDDDPAGPQGVWPFSYGQLPNYDTDNYFGRPEGFTDTAGPAGTGPQWLWDADTRTLFADAGTVYFRQAFTLAAQTDMLFEFAADDEGELWVDDVPICKTEGVYLGACVKAAVRLSAGDHLIAAKGTNLNGLRAGVVYAGWSVSDGLPDTVLVRSDASLARCLAYPADPPGFTPTEVIRLVVDEVQSLPTPRLADLTFSFISASDTDLAPLTEVVDITCHAPGDSILTLIEMLGETYLDISMTPDALEINAWIRGTRGIDKSGWLGFTQSTCQKVVHEEIGSERATVALFQGSRFGGGELEHADAVATGVYEEVALDFGDAEEDAAARFAQDYLDLVSDSRKGISIDLIPGIGPEPYVDFEVGDTISVPGKTGAAEAHRVSSIGLKVDTSRLLQWSLELDQPKVEDEERLGAIMRRQLPGSLGGRSLLPARTEPQFLSNEKGVEKQQTWQWDGTVGAPSTVVLHKNGVAVTGASATVSAGETEVVTLTDASRKFTRGSDKFTVEVDGGSHNLPEFIPDTGRWVQAIRAAAHADGDTITITMVYA